MMRSYVQVEHQEIIFYYGPFDTIKKAHKAAEKFKKNNKKIRGMKVTLTSLRSDEPSPDFVLCPTMLGPRPME